MLAVGSNLWLDRQIDPSITEFGSPGWMSYRRSIVRADQFPADLNEMARLEVPA